MKALSTSITTILALTTGSFALGSVAETTLATVTLLATGGRASADTDTDTDTDPPKASVVKAQMPAAVAFVSQLKDEVLGFYKTLSEDQRRAKLCLLIENSSDLSYMADASLGRFRNRLNELQKTEFREIFLSLITGLFDRAFLPLQDGQVIVMPNVQNLQDEHVVRMQVIRPSRSVLNLQFYLRETQPEQKLTLVDGASEGVRLVRVLQSAFDTQMSEVKGDIPAFLNNLKHKNQFCLRP